MARLFPTLTLFFCLSILLSSSHAGSPVASQEEGAVKLPPSTSDQQDVSELKTNIFLPTDKVLDSDSVSEVNRPESGKSADELQEKDMPAFPARMDLRPVNRPRCRCPLHCGHRGPRFGGGAQIRPRRMPFRKEGNDVVEDNEHRHHHHGRHGEIFSARWIDGPRSHHVDPARFHDVDGEPMMVGEFKHPRFFFHPHHHHHHHHHHQEDDDDHFHGGEEEMEGGHGFGNTIRKFLGHF